MKFQHAKIVTISFGHFTHDVYGAFLSTMLPKIIQSLGISHGLAGILFFAQRLPSAFNFLVGIWATRIKSRYFVILTPAITGVGMSLLGLAPNYATLLIILLTVGVSSTFFHVPTPVMIRKVAGDKVGLGMSYFMVGGELARTLGPLVVAAAVSAWGLHGTYRLLPFGIFASVLLYIKLRDVDIKKDIPVNKKNRDFVLTFKKHAAFFGIIIGFALFRALIKSSLTNFLPTYMNPDGSESIWVGGLPLAVMQFAGVAGTFFAGAFSDHLSKRGILVTMAILTPLAMFAFTVNTVEWLHYPLLIILGFVVFAPGPVLLSLVQQVNSNHPEFINGVYMTINFFSASLTVLLVGFLSDLLSLHTTYLIAAIAGIGAVPFAFLFAKK
ncbi:MAG: MFS transporter [Bacteroidales bacterium]